MSSIFPPPPAANAELHLPVAIEAVASFLATRRSAGKMVLAEPGPDRDTLTDILRVGARVPDHRKLEPWRFITLSGAARETFGHALAEIYSAQFPNAPEAEIAQQATLPLRAPATVFVVHSPKDDGRTPAWEQELSTGALCHQTCLAAQAAGFGAVWLTEWLTYDAAVAARLGLAEHERLAAQILIGTQTAASPERPRPDIAAKVTEWEG